MKPTRCPSCQGDQLAYGFLYSPIGFFFSVGFFRMAPAHAATCLGCGTLIPYLSQASLDKVRAWKGVAKPAGAALDEL